MFGFLFKVVLMAAVVAGGGYAYLHRDQLIQLPQLAQLSSRIKVPEINATEAGKRVSQALDSLVTHPEKNSPVILGVKITNDSLSAIVDVIAKLPPDQVSQLKQAICSSPSAQ